LSLPQIPQWILRSQVNLLPWLCDMELQSLFPLQSPSPEKPISTLLLDTHAARNKYRFSPASITDSWHLSSQGGIRTENPHLQPPLHSRRSAMLSYTISRSAQMIPIESSQLKGPCGQDWTKIFARPRTLVKTISYFSARLPVTGLG
jgi:hypothetical protein